MGWQPGQDDDRDASQDPARDPGAAGRGGSALDPERDPRLAGFAKDGEWDTCPPSAFLAAVLEGASGPEWRCPGATIDEMIGMLRQAQALESRAAAMKLGIARSLIRDDDEPLPGGGYRGDLPEGWTKSLTHQVALALSLPAVSADKLMWVAWDLQARLEGTGELLAAGALTYAKAKAVHEAFLLLSDENAARAEALVLNELPGKTYGQVKRLAEQAAITVDPEAAARRREDAEQNRCRVEMFREDSGAAALSGRDLPTDETLAAHARVCARAQQYKDSGAFPGDTRMDQFRVAAYLDLLNGRPAEARIASGQLDSVTRTADHETGSETSAADNVGAADVRAGHSNDEAVPASGGRPADDPVGQPDADVPNDEAAPASGGEPADDPVGGHPTGDVTDDDGPDDDEPGDGDFGGEVPGDGFPGDGGPPGFPGSPGSGGAANPAPPRLTDLVLPLATLLGLADRPGEGHALGPLDPDLCRHLAIAATGSPWTRLCVTVTDSAGIAIGHGCAKPPRNAKAGNLDRTQSANQATASGIGLPSQLNLTITAARLAGLGVASPREPDESPKPRPSRRDAPLRPNESSSRGEPPRPVGDHLPSILPWSFIRTSVLGPPGGFGTWILTLPDGRQFTVALEPMPTFECDHRHQSHAYQPNDRLRHLVQVRDYTCTFPPCNRHAKEADFEHAVPYDQGGATCACNAGARSRACHQVKQSKGWLVTQPRPGWHQWQTPAGRSYVQGPKRYPT